MTSSPPRKSSQQSREISGIELPQFESLGKILGAHKPSGAPRPPNGSGGRSNKPSGMSEVLEYAKEFYRQKRILRILKIRSERTSSVSILSSSSQKNKGGLRPGFWMHAIGMLIVPGIVMSFFSPITKLFPAPIQFLLNGCCLFAGIELMDWLALRKYQAPAKSETNADLQLMTATDLIQVEDELFQEAEGSVRLKSSWGAGKFMIFALSAVGWLFTIMIMEYFGIFQKLQGNPLSIPVYLGSLCIGAWIGHAVWKSISHWGRFSVRTLLHYWPLAIYLIVGAGIVLQRVHGLLN